MTNLETRLWHATKFLDVASELAMHVTYEGRKHIEDLGTVDLFRFEQMKFPIYVAVENLVVNEGKSDVILLPFHFNSLNNTDKEAIDIFFENDGNFWVSTYFSILNSLYFRLSMNQNWTTLTQVPKIFLNYRDDGTFDIGYLSQQVSLEDARRRLVPLDGYGGCINLIERALSKRN